MTTIDYDQFWRNDLSTYKNHPTSRHRRRFVRKLVGGLTLRPDAFVFDYGCGTGLALSELQGIFALRDSQLGGLDLSEEAIAQVNRKFESPHFYAGSSPSLNRLIDLAVCTEVIEHTAEYRNILHWLYGHIRPGGTLILTTPHAPMDPPDEYYGHIQHFELKDLVRDMENIGFKVDVARRWGYPFFTMQKYITRKHFDRIRNQYMLGSLTFRKKIIFGLSYLVYYIHDLINHGPQIFIRAHRRMEDDVPLNSHNGGRVDTESK